MELSISQMMQMQRELYEKHKDRWEPRQPQYGRSHILYMIEEIGEMVAILKKKGDASVVENPNVRLAFVEEMADVMMYYIDTMLCYQVTPEEFSQAFAQKYARNMGRDYESEYKELYNG